MSGSYSVKSESDRAWKQLQKEWKETNAGLADDLANAATTINNLETKVTDLQNALNEERAAHQKNILELRNMLQRVMAIFGIVRSKPGISYLLDKDRNFRKCVKLYDKYMVKHALSVAELYPDLPASSKEGRVDDDVEDEGDDCDADEEREAPDFEKTPRPPVNPSSKRAA